MSLFIEWPLLGVVPALILLGLYRLFRRRSTLYAAIAWLLYVPYELAMRWRWLCSGECNIRLDLLLVYPMLVLLSLIGILAASRGRASG
ncbi:hypothetical protein BH24GEM1_BH24GEM1_13070 [soil metagenome]